MRKIERLINLLAFLLDSRRPRSLDEIRSRVLGYEGIDSEEAFRRAFERDKDELRELGVPIEYHEEEGYFIPKDAYYLPALAFEPEEALALSLAARIAETQPLLPARNRLHSALLKILFDTEAPSPEEKPPLVVRLGEGTEELERRLEVLDEAVGARKVVKFSYRGISDAEPHERTVEPYGRFYRQGHWYLAGRCRTRGRLRLFRVDRIRGDVEPVAGRPKGRDYEIPPGFSVAEYARKELWELSEEEGPLPVKVKLRVAPHLLPALRPFISTVERPEGEGGAEAREVILEATNRDFFLQWLLGLGEGVELVEPAEWRREALSLLSAAEEAVGGAAAYG